MGEMIVGRNPVREALKAGGRVKQVYLARGLKPATMAEITDLARLARIPVQTVSRSDLDQMLPDTVHQGIAAEVKPYRYGELDDVLAAPDAEPLLILLDEVTDPHNLGAIIRSAAAAGAHGVIIPKHRAVGVTPAVVKAAAGTIELVPIIKVTNLVAAIERLKKHGLWVVGADAAATQIAWQAPLDGPLALVVGGEDKGLGRLVKEKCDLLVKLPLAQGVNSLNASVAAALLMFEVVRQRNRGRHG